MNKSLSIRGRVSLAAKTLVGLYTGPQGLRSSELIQGIFPGAIGTPPDRTANEFLRAYGKSPWLRAVTSKIAHSTAVVPWRLYQAKSKPQLARRLGRIVGLDPRRRMMKSAMVSGDLREVEQHPLLDVFNNPNSWFTGLVNRRLTQQYLDLNGEVFLLKERATPTGPPIALWPIPGPWVINTPTPGTQTYKVSFRGWQGDIPETEILWICDPDPANPYGRGNGTANALADELDTDEFASKYLRAFFYNRATPDVIVWPKGTDAVDEKALRSLKQRWLQEHQGFWKAFRPFFSSREIDVKVISNTLDEMKISDLRAFERDTVINVFGMSPEILGVITNSNRATIDAADYLFQKGVVNPRLEFQRAVYQFRLVPEFDDPSLLLDYDSPIKEDAEFALKTVVAYPQAFTVDEVRELAGKEPLGKGKGGNVIFVPSGYDAITSYDDIVMTSADVLAGGGGADPFAGTPIIGDDPPAAEQPDNPDAGDNPEPDPNAGKGLSRWRRSLKTGRKGAQPGAARIARSLEPKARKRFLDALKKLDGHIDADALATAYEASKVDDVVAAIKWQLFASDLKPALNVIMAGFEAAGTAEAAHVATQLRVDFAFNVKNPRAVAYAKKNSARLIVDVTKSTKAGVRTIVSRCLDQQLSRTEATAMIRAAVGLTDRQAGAVAKFRDKLTTAGEASATVNARVSKYAGSLRTGRAQLIARTEIQTATNEGQHESWSQASDKGLIDTTTTKRVWIVTDDDRLDTKICEPMDGQEVDLDEAFTDGDGEDCMDPPAHVGCRCSQGLVFDK